MILLFAGCDHVNVMAKDDGSNELCKFRTSEGSGIDIRKGGLVQSGIFLYQLLFVGLEYWARNDKLQVGPNAGGRRRHTAKWSLLQDQGFYQSEVF